MADIKKIKVDGTTYDIRDATAARSNHTHSFDTITNRGEAFLSWGGKNFSGTYGPIDAAMVPELGANRLAFMPADAVTIEYSRDGGATWTDYGPTDSQKIDLFNGRGASFTIGKATSGAGNIATNKYQLRVNIYTSAGKVYTALNKFVIYLSTSGTNGNWCTIRARTQSDYAAGNDKWTTFADKISVSGWSGYNVINTSGITTYGNTASTQYGHIQFIFGCDTGSTNNSYAGLNINKIFGFGGVGWTTPSTMAKTGHMYTYDSSQNVIFPEGVSAKSFTEGGTSLANKYAAKSHTHNYAASDSAGGPANRVKKALTFGSKTYDGSTAQTITASDLGALTSHQDISGKVNKSGDTMTGDLNPKTTKGASLGTSSLYWNNIYGTTLYEDGTSLANKYLGKTAKAADADKLNGNDFTYYLNYNNLNYRPTLGTAASKNTGTSSGNIPILDSNGKLADSVIPAVAITDTYVVATEAAMLALSAQKGDIAIRSDLNKSFVLQVTPASTLANWKELLTPTDVVLSVNGKTGAVTLNLDNINDGSTRKLADYVKKSLTSAKGDIIYASGANTPARLGIGSTGQFLSVANGIPTWVNNPNTNTWRKVQLNGTDKLGTGINTNPLNIKAGSNMTITESNGTFTFAATDTNTHNSHIVYSGKKSDGTTDISSGTASSGNITLGDSGVTAGAYGDTTAQTPGYGKTFKVPSISVNAKGIVTAIGEHTVTIPASDNTNTSHSHSAGVGLVGSGSAGTSGTYTYKAKLRSETALTLDSAAATTTSGRVYPVAVDKSGYLSVNVPWTDTDTNTHNSHAIISGTKSDNSTQIKGSSSSGDITLGDSGASAGSYGNASNQEPGYGKTFNVPYITVNAKGIVTAISNKTVKIPASDNTNTATAADNILDGSNSGTQITYAPYAAQQSKLSFDTSTTAPTRTDRLNLNGYLYATKFNVAGKAAVQYNSTEDCIEFIFA